MTSRPGQPPSRDRLIRHTRKPAATAVLALLLAAGAAQAAPVVTYVASDLPDASPGVDLWQIAYTIGGTAAAFESVNLVFDSAAFAGLVPGAAPPELMLLETQPDPGLPADGQVTATLLFDLGAPTSFTVDFTWLGGGQPGAQPYEYLDAGFSLLGTGTTRDGGGTSVPEPAMLPAVLGLAGLATWLRRRKAGLRR